MQFETIAITIFALALLVFMYTRRRVITDLKEQNEKLQKYVSMLTDVGNRQRDEITKLIDTAEQERRAHQMATLTSRPAPRPPITKPTEWKDPDLARDPYKNTRAAASRSTVASKQEEATRRRTQDQAPANTWTDPGIPYTPAASPAPAPAPAYHGGGGSFDGGGASGDYGRSGSCSSSSSSSSDSGASSSCSSSDSGSNSSSSD